MSLSNVRGVLTGSGAKGSARLVLTILASFANERQCARPSVATMANVSPRQVQLDLRKLVQLGELAQVSAGGGRNRPAEYRITLQTCSPIQLPERVKSMKGVSSRNAGSPAKGETVKTCSPEVLGAHGATRAVFSLSSYSEEERTVIDLYHAKLVNVTSGWLPVTMFTPKVREAIALHSPKAWESLFEDYAHSPQEWPERRTLVRLAWHNY